MSAAATAVRQTRSAVMRAAKVSASQSIWIGTGGSDRFPVLPRSSREFLVAPDRQHEAPSCPLVLSAYRTSLSPEPEPLSQLSAGRNHPTATFLEGLFCQSRKKGTLRHSDYFMACKLLRTWKAGPNEYFLFFVFLECDQDSSFIADQEELRHLNQVWGITGQLSTTHTFPQTLTRVSVSWHLQTFFLVTCNEVYRVLKLCCLRMKSLHLARSFELLERKH